MNVDLKDNVWWNKYVQHFFQNWLQNSIKFGFYNNGTSKQNYKFTTVTYELEKSTV